MCTYTLYIFIYYILKYYTYGANGLISDNLFTAFVTYS